GGKRLDDPPDLFIDPGHVEVALCRINRCLITLIVNDECPYLLQDGRRRPSYGTQEGVKPVGLLLHYCQLRHAGLRHCEAAVCWNEEVTIFLEGRIHHPVMAIPRHNVIE